ncbi:hypothetical protein AAAZ42_19265 [Bacteroides ovatus]|uniref:hypothetical protein n=1 Tax=Bacteroides ovatus TaxID=28116 RepID=UPI0032C00640
MKQRNISIDILKCFAALIITNSHMDILYPKFGALATGGAIGDALFSFVLVSLYSWVEWGDLIIGINDALTVFILLFLHGQYLVLYYLVIKII